MGKKNQSSLIPPPSEVRPLSWPVVLALVAISLTALGELAGDVQPGEASVFDRAVMEAMGNLASPLLTSGLRLVTASASTLVVTGLTLALGIWWWRQSGRRPEVIILFATVAGSAALGQVLKSLYRRPRPQIFPWLAAAGGWSFPSGHTLAAMALGGSVAWLVGWQQSSRRRVAMWGVAGLWTLLVGLSRVYLGVHYPTDVLASVSVGVLCLLLASCIVRIAVPNRRV